MSDIALDTLAFLGLWFLASAIFTAVYVLIARNRVPDDHYRPGERYWMKRER